MCINAQKVEINLDFLLCCLYNNCAMDSKEFACLMHDFKGKECMFPPERHVVANFNNIKSNIISCMALWYIKKIDLSSVYIKKNVITLMGNINFTICRAWNLNVKNLIFPLFYNAVYIFINSPIPTLFKSLFLKTVQRNFKSTNSLLYPLIIIGE